MTVRKIRALTQHSLHSAGVHREPARVRHDHGVRGGEGQASHGSDPQALREPDHMGMAEGRQHKLRQ